MEKNKTSISTKIEQRSEFPTIDDAYARVEESYHLLRQLKNLKHPLAVRKGYVPNTVRGIGSKRKVLASNRTYYVEARKTNNGKNFIRITESRGKDSMSMAMYVDEAQGVITAISEVISFLKRQ